MSSDADAAAAAAALFNSLYTANYCIAAAAVLFIYDTFITLDREVTYFWTTKRINGAALLFFANKWISMTVYVMELVEFASFPSDKVAGDNVNGSSLVTAFTAPLTAIAISRFLLELQETNHMVVRLDPHDRLHFSRDAWDSTPSFISSLGGFVNPARSARSDDDDVIEFQVRTAGAPREEEGQVPVEVPESAVLSSSTV
ncbi:hypothetical protein K466DRAFT_601773 [Polyporus arcularius HHB13444]|uniref:DUF6533 domain-containing protein n=1 Tax=Polyporus arcularius HHB13444 TaxID=1314778 RepID=A0A5C3P832_9APHY|nr:hypothetical protein K466DRAFT_601773 [Polyporus arcularius HHB13444]